jgi:hypothetical protein
MDWIYAVCPIKALSYYSLGRGCKAGIRRVKLAIREAHAKVNARAMTIHS